jgi:transcriptional regulator with XRE-family HTH domain
VDDIRSQITASRILARRGQLGLTQDGLAGRAGKTSREVRRWEHGEHAPQWPNIQVLAEALECSPLWLAGVSDDPLARAPEPMIS